MSAKVQDLKDGRVPPCLYWSHSDVAKWMEELGFPQYKDCLTSNMVDGKKLILLDSSALPKIGITDFEHIKTIAKSIRDLLTIEEPFWNKTISEPPRSELGMYLERKSRTGEISSELTYGKYQLNNEELKWQPPLANHCLILPKN